MISAGTITRGSVYLDEDRQPHFYVGDERFLAWMRENDLDPTVVTDLRLDGDQIHVEEIRYEDGKVQLDPESMAAQKTARTVPLIVPPPDCMLNGLR